MLKFHIISSILTIVSMYIIKVKFKVNGNLRKWAIKNKSKFVNAGGSQLGGILKCCVPVYIAEHSTHALACGVKENI